ncbi:MAG: hypothetical protein ACKPKO_24840, partial [Candidatus Fonsibacter sp.]
DQPLKIMASFRVDHPRPSARWGRHHPGFDDDSQRFMNTAHPRLDAYHVEDRLDHRGGQSGHPKGAAGHHA